MKLTITKQKQQELLNKLEDEGLSIVVQIQEGKEPGKLPTIRHNCKHEYCITIPDGSSDECRYSIIIALLVIFSRIPLEQYEDVSSYDELFRRFPNIYDEI